MPLSHHRIQIDAVFGDLLAHIVASSPVAATDLGDHRRDAELDDWAPSEADRRLRELAGLRRRVDELAGTDAPDADEAGDLLLLGDSVDAMRFELEGMRSHATDPLHYLGLATGGVYDLIRRVDLPVAPRQAAAASRAGAVVRLLDQARANLTELPEPRRDLALLRLPGAIDLFREVLPGFAVEAAEAGEEAARACEAFGAWLTDATPSPQWRLGEQRWNDALRLALGVRMPADEVWERGQAKLAVLAEQAEALAGAVLGGSSRGLAGPKLVRAGLEVAAADCSQRRTLVSDAAEVLGGVKDFLCAWGEIDLPDPDTLRVEEVPDFMQGSAVAYFVPAPPLEPEAASTYYLSPVPDDWDDERAGSFLREYNVHALRCVGIHEAYPGHYVQLASAQRHPRLLRRTLWNSAFAEGWAVYVERRVIQAGFGGNGNLGDADKLRLISTKMEMRAVANALLDQGLHVHGWDDDQALRLMVDTTYQERSEARGKLVRGKTSAGQLSTYFVGGEEMDDLRCDAEARHGSAFDALAFHRQVLGQGTPPFAVLRRGLLGEAS